MSIIDTLVYDRTQNDVDRVLFIYRKILTGGFESLSDGEKAEYMATMKGSYNYEDMNRVGEAVSYIANRMTELPDILAAYRKLQDVADADIYHVPYDPAAIVVDTKTDWFETDIPSQELSEDYLWNVSVLRGALTLPKDAPSVPDSLTNLNYTAANDIEYLLYVIDAALTGVEEDIKSKVDRTVSAFAYTGLFNCGE